MAIPKHKVFISYHHANDQSYKESLIALLGLTVLHSLSNFIPNSGDIGKGLNLLNDLFGKVIYGDLPVGADWLDHLDILGAMRISTFGGELKKAEEYIPERLSGYVDVGIEKESEDYTKALELWDKNKLPKALLVDHLFNQSYGRLSIPNRESLNQMKQQRIENRDGTSTYEELSEDQIEVLRSIYDLYKKDANLRQQNIKSFMNEWNDRENLTKLRTWLDSIDTSFQLTSAGKVLAHSNAQRCDKNLPAMD